MRCDLCLFFQTGYGGGVGAFGKDVLVTRKCADFFSPSLLRCLMADIRFYFISGNVQYGKCKKKKEPKKCASTFQKYSSLLGKDERYLNANTQIHNICGDQRLPGPAQAWKKGSYS